VVERFAEFEREHDRLHQDLRLPEPFKQQESERLWNALHDDVSRLEIDMMSARNRKLTDEIKAEEMKLRNINPGDMMGLFHIIDRATDVNTLVDLADEELIIGNGARIRRVLPAIEAKLGELAKNSPNETLRATVRGVSIAAEEWRKANPSPLARRRELHAKRERTIDEVGAAFEATRERLGMRVR